jgi:hypothetical protein
MTEKLTSLTRRVLLGLAAIAPFALLGGQSRRARSQPTCQYPDGEFFQKPEAQQAGDMLWAAFQDGMDDMRFFFTTELEPGLQEDRTMYHGHVICRNWDEYLKDPAATEECCRMAGRLAEVLRSKEGTEKVTKPQFLGAVEAIRVWQAEKAGEMGISPVGGGAC